MAASLSAALHLLLLLLVGTTCQGSADHSTTIGELASKSSEAMHEVTLTASGALHRNQPRERPSTIMRRHADQDEEPSKAMFQSMDLDGDGLVTALEVETSLHASHSRIPKGLAGLVDSVDGDGDGKIDYLEFLAAARKQKANDMPVHEHFQSSWDADGNRAESEDRGFIEERNVGERTDKHLLGTPWVTCGGHKAPSCQACTTTDSNGQTVFDHGQEWCHGDCQYAQGACHPQGTIHVQGTVQGSARAYHSTTALPDLLNPNITSHDAETINNAADHAIREENLEAAEKQRKEEEALEAEKFSWSKFWLVVIISFSVILGICAVVSLIALCVFCLMATPGPAPKEEGDDETEGLMNGEESGTEGDAVKSVEATKISEDQAGNEEAKPEDA